MGIRIREGDVHEAGWSRVQVIGYGALKASIGIKGCKPNVLPDL
jgi:hypothetical protein